MEWVLGCSNFHQETQKQRLRNKNKQTNKIKSTRKLKRMENITPAMDHYPRNGYMGDTDP